MRIRKRLLLQSSDPQLHRSEAAAAAAPPLQPSDPPKHPPNQNMAIGSIIRTWLFPKSGIEEQKMQQQDLANDDETLKGDEKSIINDIRRILINISDEQVSTKKNLQPSSSSSSAQALPRPRGDNEDVPLKKRKEIFDENPDEEETSPETKSKTNNINRGDNIGFQVNGTNESVISNGAKKIKRGNVIMEGSRCSRVNGRGWRCCQATLVGYSLCEHHLGKGKLRTMTSVRHRPNTSIGDSGAPPLSGGEPKIVTKKRTKMVKARSLNSLLGHV